MKALDEGLENKHIRKTGADEFAVHEIRNSNDNLGKMLKTK